MKLKHPQLFHQACYIDGKWVEGTKNFAVHNPSTGQKLGDVPCFGVEETRTAIEAAAKAFPTWSSKLAKERSQILKKWFDLILENIDDLAAIMTSEQGKPLTESISEIRYAASFVEWFAEEAKRVYGDIIPPVVKNQRILVIKQPIGVVGAITPWNFPAAMVTRKCAPALAVGCTVVLKPAELTPYSALALAHLAEKAGLPPGVLNILTGDAASIGAELTRSPLVRKIAFTGSTRVGKLLMTQSAPTLKKISLELGGSAPFIVFSDADLTAAVQGLIASKFRNMGQTCICANRIFVQESIYDSFARALAKEVKKLKVGDGFEAGVQQGPLIHETALKKVEELVADALAKGAEALCGGKRHPLGRTFYEPTILSEVTLQMRISREEAFGPVAPLIRFKTDEEAIQMANDSEYGLASYLYSRDVDRVCRTAEQLEAGIVSVNGGLFSSEVIPFGGIKESGFGREGSKYGVEDFLQIKSICLTNLSQ